MYADRRKMPRPGAERGPVPGRREESAAPLRHRLGTSAILALQRHAGNQAVKHLLSTPSAVTVQRARLNIRPNGTISGVSGFPSRPPSNLRGKQGQHLTAYVAFEDTILSHVRDRTPEQAAQALIGVAEQFKALPFMVPKNPQNGYLHQYFDSIIAELTAELQQNPPDVASLRSTIGYQIDELLKARNQIPSTAISELGTKGHGEATVAGGLETMETALRTGKAGSYGDAEAEQAVSQMWQLLDYDPPEPDTPEKLELVQRRVLTHVTSMRLAYPEVFAWLTNYRMDYWLMPYLRAHRSTFTSLGRLSDKTLKSIQEYVHSNL